MKYYSVSLKPPFDDSGEYSLMVGIELLRFNHQPIARYFYNFRLHLLVVKIEIQWTTGEVLPPTKLL